MITSGEGKYKVWLEERTIGDERIFILGGGEQSHIGALVFCDPGQEPLVLRREGHYDDVVLIPLAQAACEKYNTPVAVLGGIHIEQATKDEIEIIIKNCKQLATLL